MGHAHLVEQPVEIGQPRAQPFERTGGKLRDEHPAARFPVAKRRVVVGPVEAAWRAVDRLKQVRSPERLTDRDGLR